MLITLEKFAITLKLAAVSVVVLCFWACSPVEKPDPHDPPEPPEYYYNIRFCTVDIYKKGQLVPTFTYHVSGVGGSSQTFDVLSELENYLDSLIKSELMIDYPGAIEFLIQHSDEYETIAYSTVIKTHYVTGEEEWFEMTQNIVFE